MTLQTHSFIGSTPRFRYEPDMANTRFHRRRFLGLLTMALAGGRTLLATGEVRAAVDAALATDSDPRTWPEIPRRVLAGTEFAASRLVFGCGATLSRRPNDPLLEAAFAAGINVFDVGSSDFYGDAEKNLAPFLKRVRNDVFLISKARAAPDLQPGDALSAGVARLAASRWSTLLDGSLRELGVAQLDAYYVMAANHPGLVASDELLAAFTKAKAAGKVRHLGLSSHQNAERVLDAASATGAYSLAMVAVTPAGWYDLPSKGIPAGTQPMTALAPVFARARAAGIGLIGMKAGRYLAGGRFLGWSRPSAFDAYYGEKLRQSELSPFQRSYAYVLEHGLDAVNADMQTIEHLRTNVIAAASSASFA